MSTMSNIELQSILLGSSSQSPKSLFDCIPESENVSCRDCNANSTEPTSNVAHNSIGVARGEKGPWPSPTF